MRSRAWRPHLAAVAGGGVDVGVEPDRQHDDGARQPRGEAGDHRVARRPVAARAQRVHDRQVAVDRHRRHREYARVAVHLYSAHSRRPSDIHTARPPTPQN